jgi:hypothetical protein
MPFATIIAHPSSRAVINYVAQIRARKLLHKINLGHHDLVLTMGDTENIAHLNISVG